MAGPFWTRGGSVLVVLSLLACAVSWAISFKNEREKTLEKYQTWQLQRIGLLIGSTDQERAAALAAANQARGDTERVLWLRQQPTKPTYTVGPQAGRDFRTLGDALGHLERVIRYRVPTSFVNVVDASSTPFFTLLTSTGTYDGPLKVSGPVQIRAEGVAGGVVLRSGDPSDAVVTLEHLKEFKQAPALTGVTVLGGSQVSPVRVASAQHQHRWPCKWNSKAAVWHR